MIMAGRWIDLKITFLKFVQSQWKETCKVGQFRGDSKNEKEPILILNNEN